MESGCRGENYVCDMENPAVIFPLIHSIFGDRDSAVGTANGYGLDGPGFEPRGRQDFSGPIPAHPASLSWRVRRSGSGATTHPFLAPRLGIGTAISQPTLTGVLRDSLYLYHSTIIEFIPLCP
jgi:hypothetical protein